MRLRRKTGVGIHRVKIPKIGWATVRPGEELPGDHEDISFLKGEKENYYAISGQMPTEPEEEPEPTRDYALATEALKDGKFNVVNPDTRKPINSKPLSAEEARKLMDITEKDCPLENGTFGEDYDEFEECLDCVNNDLCGKA